ncbi:MAG: ABC transporter permease subunit [Phycisphaerae bacterium]|nr:ABC transporter permease subunit [Phycisphaerae bacterium]
MPVILRWLLRLGPTNPIAVRLVQGGSRRARDLYVRSAYLGVLIAVLLYALLLQAPGDELSYQKLAAAGARSFQWIAYLQIGLICVLAPVFMAGAIAQESDPRTWDILLTTPLGATEIVLGNLFGRLFFILALLLSSLPLFAVTQYFGGVAGASIFGSYLIAACATLFVGTTAIMLSVSRLVGRRAVFTFYVSVVSYLVVTWGVDGVMGAGTGSVTWATAMNPFLSLRALLDPSGYASWPADPGRAWAASLFLEAPVRTFCTLSLVLSVLMTGISIATVRLGGMAGLGGGSGPGGAPWHRRVLGLGAAGAETRPARSVWINPIAWREAAARNATLGRIAARWTFIGLGGLFGLSMVGAYHVGWMSHAEFRSALAYTTVGEMTVIVLVAMNMAATSVSREREDGTLDLLLTTPIDPPRYLSGKLRGMMAYLLPMLAVPLGTMAAAGLYVLAEGLGRADGVSVVERVVGRAVDCPTVLPEGALVLPVVAGPFLTLCVMVGLQWSVKSRGVLSSVIGTVGVVFAVAGTVGLCGWRSGLDLPVLGPVLAGLSPVSAALAIVHPVGSLTETVDKSDLTAARVGLAIGALVGGLLYAAAVYALHASLVRNFDMTVRRLAGNK